MLRIHCAFLALVLFAGSAFAGIDNAGTTAGNFLSVGTGASILSMGGATLGTGDDLHAAAWNSASLARLDFAQFALSHASLASQSTLDLASAGGRAGRSATRWAASVLYEGEGSFDGRDAFGASTGSFNASSMAFGLQLARPLGGIASAGVGARWLTDNLGDTRGSGVAFDAGLQARSGSFGLGAAVRNVGGSMRYPSGSYDLPEVYGVGASWSDAAHGVRLALDANFPRAYYNDLRMGAEWRWQDRLALRGGYRLEMNAAANEPLGGPSFGLGMGVNGVWMDYAFLAGNAQAQGEHRLGLTFSPGLLNRGHAPAGTDLPQGVTSLKTPRPSRSVRRVVRSVSRQSATVTFAPVTLAIVTSAPMTRLQPSALVAETPAAPLPPAGKVVPAPRIVIDLTDRVPPGGTESEVYLRDIPSAWVLAPSDPVEVRPLLMVKPTGSFDVPVASDSPSHAEVMALAASSMSFGKNEKPQKEKKGRKPSRSEAMALAMPIQGPPIAIPTVVQKPPKGSARTKVETPAVAVKPVPAPRPAPAAVVNPPAPAVASTPSPKPAPVTIPTVPFVTPAPKPTPKPSPSAIEVPPAPNPAPVLAVIVPPAPVVAPAPKPEPVLAAIVPPAPAVAPAPNPAPVVVEPPPAPVVAPAPKPIPVAIVPTAPVVTPPAPAPKPEPVAVQAPPAPEPVVSAAVPPAPAVAPKPAPVVAPAPVVTPSAPAPAPVVAPPAPAPAPVVTPPAPTPVVTPPAAVEPVALPAPAPADSPVVTPPAPSPEPVANPAPPAVPAAAPQRIVPPAPVAPQPAPAPEKAPKTSPWPAVSATMPDVKVASLTPRVSVVTYKSKDVATPAARQARPDIIVVRDGETIEDIAKFWNTSPAAIMMENNMIHSAVKRGQKLKLPR